MFFTNNVKFPIIYKLFKNYGTNNGIFKINKKYLNSIFERSV